MRNYNSEKEDKGTAAYKKRLADTEELAAAKNLKRIVNNASDDEV